MHWMARLWSPRQRTAELAQRADGRRSVGISFLLLLLPLMLLLPLLVYSGSLLYLFAQQVRASTEHDLLAADQALAIVVQRELERTLETMSLVAESPALGEPRPDLHRLAELLRSVVNADVGLSSLIVVDRGGHVLAEFPPRNGAPDRIALDAAQLQAFDTGRPQVSVLEPGPRNGRLAITLAQPAQRDRRVPWVISGEFDPHFLATVLASQVGSRDAVATVLDPLYRVLARTRDMDRTIGQRISTEALSAMASTESVKRLSTFEGQEYLWAWTTTPAGWSVLLGLPAEGIDSALWQSMGRLAAVGLALLVLGGGTMVLLARRIARSVDRMAANVPRLGRGETPPFQPSRIRQLDALYDALLEANRQVAQALADRDRALSAERVARRIADEDNRAKDVFIATLSHELRNPLAPVRSATMILKSPKADEAARRRATQVIERQVAAMAKLLEDLLDLSRIRSGRIELARRRVSLRSVLESAIEVARPLIEARGHEFSCILPGEDLLLDADPLRLSQAFANLLTNAAKYTEPGGRIAIWAERHEQQVAVHVQDNGIGLAPDELEQVFQMFAQVHGAQDRTQGGLGIGLWLVRSLVELHGGWVRAESHGHGQGSEFVVGLPLAATPD